MNETSPAPGAAPIQPDSIIRLPDAQAEQLAAVMARAFFHDPMFLYVTPDEEKRTARLRWFFRSLIRYSTWYGEIYTTTAVDGGAIWVKPEYTTFTLGRMIKIGFLKMPFVFGWTGFTRFLNLSNTVDKWHEESVTTDHWYLTVLGVEPDQQSQGVGGALMQPLLARVDAAGLPCYLETLSERNLPFYRRHGFEITFSGKVPDGGPMAWAMVRSPQ